MTAAPRARTTGTTVSDPATAALLDLAGDVGGLRLLEVACGQGRVARELARRGAALTGLDISAALLAKAEAYEAAEPLGICYRHADVTAGGLLEGQVFDGVVSNYGGAAPVPFYFAARCLRIPMG